MWEKFIQKVKGIGNFFTGISNLASYPDVQKQIEDVETKTQGQINDFHKSVSDTFSNVASQMTNIQLSLEANKEAMNGLSLKMDNFNGELTKIKEGLQMELFSSLQALHARLKDQRFATIEDKMEAKRYYDQIHNLGKDGWSQRYYDEIIQMPESREDYWKSLNGNN